MIVRYRVALYIVYSNPIPNENSNQISTTFNINNLNHLRLFLNMWKLGFFLYFPSTHTISGRNNLIQKKVLSHCGEKEKYILKNQSFPHNSFFTRQTVKKYLVCSKIHLNNISWCKKLFEAFFIFLFNLSKAAV
jgi:hypothetical protein